MNTLIVVRKSGLSNKFLVDYLIVSGGFLTAFTADNKEVARYELRNIDHFQLFPSEGES